MKVETKLALILSTICVFLNEIAISDAEEEVASVPAESQVIRTKMSSLVNQGKLPTAGKMGVSALLGEAELLKDFAAFMKGTMAELVNLKQEIISTKEQLKLEIAAQGKSLTNKIDAQGNALTYKIETQGSSLTNKIEAQGSALTNKIVAQGSALTNKIGDQRNALMKKIENQGSRLTNKVENQISTFKLAVNADIKSLQSAQSNYRCEMGRTKIKDGSYEQSQKFTRPFKDTPKCTAGAGYFVQTRSKRYWHGVQSFNIYKNGIKVRRNHKWMNNWATWICCGNQ